MGETFRRGRTARVELDTFCVGRGSKSERASRSEIRRVTCSRRGGGRSPQGLHREALRSGGDEAGLVGDHDELDSVSRAQLREDAGDVRLDRQGAQVEGFCDFAVGASARDKPEYFELARAELVESLRIDGRCLFGLCDVRLDESLGDAWSEEGFACGDEVDRGEQVAWLSAFE